MTESPKFYGIYRGTVVNNIDPLMLGRITVTPSTWAMPCVLLAGKQMGTFMVPPAHRPSGPYGIANSAK